MTDYSELKKAAEYAQDFKSHADEAEEMRALSAFYDEVDPADVLDLIAENEALLEVAARATYEAWSQQPGYVPWVAGGNSLKQDEARAIVRAAMSKEAGRG